jgi:tRNA (adenine57-N1/adenine58-N1)-methyltransferase catalytic subunit
MPSPFFSAGSVSQPDDLAILHLRRDLLIPTILQTHDDEDLGYEEGKVTNTRFGSFPHSTLLGKPWGSQIVASAVDTGSRGRRPSKKAGSDTQHLKRKAEELDSPGITDEAKPLLKPAIAASSGFIHLLRPTPESWTASLPHRTQVVYTPDYSYILHRLRVRPGSTIIEAGAGSGSFTHAAARAVFDGYPTEQPATKKRRLGRVYSFEFHPQRVEKLSKEIEQHRLGGLVEVTHRDVYNDGFLLGNSTSPNANAIFLDLPAPWQALKHLIREPPSGLQSPLDPLSPVHICTFSPCLEQAQRTISTLRQLSWLSISMVEVHHKRIEVRREGYGLDSGSVRGATVFPRSVDEAISKLLLAEDRAKQFREAQIVRKESHEATPDYKTGETENYDTKSGLPDKFTTVSSSQSQGRLVHRTEPELKTHTSYLVFAILPCSWSEAEEQRCRQSWPSSNHTTQVQEMVTPKSKKDLKREAYAERQRLKAQQQKTAGGSPKQGKMELEPKD